MTAPVLVRLALGLLALAAVVWLATGLRASRLESEGQAVVDRVRENPPQAELESAIETLSDARRFNADKEPTVNEALLLWQAGKLQRATALSEEVVSEEPDNVEGWFALWATSLVAGDRPRAAQAFAQLRVFDPLRANAAERLTPQEPAGP